MSAPGALPRWVLIKGIDSSRLPPPTGFAHRVRSCLALALYSSLPTRLPPRVHGISRRGPAFPRPALWVQCSATFLPVAIMLRCVWRGGSHRRQAPCRKPPWAVQELLPKGPEHRARRLPKAVPRSELPSDGALQGLQAIPRPHLLPSAAAPPRRAPSLRQRCPTRHQQGVPAFPRQPRLPSAAAPPRRSPSHG